MKKFYLYLIPFLFISFALLSPPFIGSDLGTPNVQSVYGGRINAITGYVKTADSTRIFVATESANSVFYADMYTAPSGTPVFTNFKVVPGLDDSKGFGSGISRLAAHAASGYLYFINNGTLYSTDPDTDITNTAIPNGVSDIIIKGDYVFALQNSTNLNFGTLASNGSFSLGSGSPITVSATTGQAKFIINPVTGKVFIFDSGTTPKLYISDDDYMSFTATTKFTDISPTLVSAGVTWNAFGIAPDGRLFFGGDFGQNIYIAYSDDGGVSYTEGNTTKSGVSAKNFDFTGTAVSYTVYYSSLYSSFKGESGWTNFGNLSSYTHPNDGAVFTDPNNEDIVYITTDQGLGVSVDRGQTVTSADGGIEAVQVNDMEMTADKNTAWIASKSGIRKVTNYQTTPTWTDAIFPNNDGSPYYSVGMNPSDANTAYAGNLRIYKTNNGGSSWIQLFTPEVAPYNYPSVGTKANAITVCRFNENLVMAGFELDGTDKGGLFYSLDAGLSWNQLLLDASSGHNDVDVNDIVFNVEGNDTIAYVGVDYDLSAPTGRSIYKVTKSGATFSVAQDMNATTTSTGNLIVASIKDLAIDTIAHTIFASGTDAGVNHPIAYNKPLATSGLWTPYTTSGFPIAEGKIAKAITVGVDTVYCAVDNEVYYYPVSGSSWTLGYTYPVGTNINFLYFDDLLVGTGTGLYAQASPISTLGIDEYYQNVNGNLKIYPNPIHSHQSLQVNYDLKKGGDTQIAVYDIQGRELIKTRKSYQSPGNYSLSLSPNKFKSGIYFVTIKLNNTTILSKKLLVQ